MSVTIRFLGTAAFELVSSSGVRILMDPYLDENPLSPLKTSNLEHLDLLLVTHAAYDHLGDSLAILRKFPDLQIVCGADVRAYLMRMGIEGARIVASPWGMKVKANGVVIRPVYSRHWSFIQGPDGETYSSVPLGMIVELEEGISIYNSGDTALYSDMKLYGELYRPLVGLINVGVPNEHQGMKHGVDDYLTGEMDAQEAALAAQWWGVRYAIPCHHDSLDTPEVQSFRSILDQRRHNDKSAPEPVLIAPGEAFVVPEMDA
jgi:L-ascorbate metabolism protein UlaG (beta-lactamase superfamily)